jgi:iron complex transport system substrate-binding protein
VQYDDSDGTPIAEVAQVNPDLILATNSGLTEEEYDKLSKIAPVVAFPKAPWTTPWQDSLEMVGRALGLSDKAAEVKANLDAQVDEAKATYPQIQGKSMIFAYLTTADLSQIGIYGTSDPRVSFMKDLGFVDAPSVAQIVKDTEFYAPVSAEKASELESDVVLAWLDNPKDMATFKRHKLIGQIPAIASGHVYGEADKEIGLAVTNPTPLSIPFVIEHFLPEAAAAVDGS